MYSTHYRILFTKRLSESEVLTLKMRVIELMVKTRSIVLADAPKDRSLGDICPLKDMRYWIGNDHMHVLSPAMHKVQHQIWFEVMLKAAELFAIEMGCPSGEILVEYRTVSNNDRFLHEFVISMQDSFHALYDGEYASWNCPQEDGYFDAHSIHHRIGIK